jgi:hypothetical protein
VKDAPVLNVRPLADTDGLDIATEHSSVKHTRVQSQANIANDCGGPCHKSRSLYLRLGIQKFFKACVDIHEQATTPRNGGNFVREPA